MTKKVKLQAFLVALVCFFCLAPAYAGGLGPIGPPVNVPDVVGATLDDAYSAITAVGLSIDWVTPQHSLSVVAGNIISESPVAGTSVDSGSSVGLVFSVGPFPDINTPMTVSIALSGSYIVTRPLSNTSMTIQATGLQPILPP